MTMAIRPDARVRRAAFRAHAALLAACALSLAAPPAKAADDAVPWPTAGWQGSSTPCWRGPTRAARPRWRRPERWHVR